MNPGFSDVNAELSLSYPSLPSKNAPTTVTGSDRLTEKSLDVKYVTWSFNKEAKNWEYRDTINEEGALAEYVEPLGTDATEGDWEDYCFVVVRKETEIEQSSGPTKLSVSFEFRLQNAHLVRACQEVMGRECPGVAWNLRPVKLKPELILAYFQQLEEYYEGLLSSLKQRTEDDECTIKALGVFIHYVRKNYRHTLSRIRNLLSDGEITFDLFYALLVPGEVFVTRCPVTDELHAMRLLSWALIKEAESGPFYSLRLESLATTVGTTGSDGINHIGSNFGMLECHHSVHEFKYVERIHDQSIYPLKYDSKADTLRSMLVTRGRKWASLNGVFHKEYQGAAVHAQMEKVGIQGGSRLRKRVLNVRSRIILDKENFSMLSEERPTLRFEERDHPGIYRPKPKWKLLSMKEGANIPEDEDLLFASPVVYGLSLSDNIWLAFNVNNIFDIEWNDEAFASLVLQEGRKTLLRSLVEANGDLGFARDRSVFKDFIPGKGHGLVINLFGPPGVGKTLSAEATSEHLRRPLYMIGSGQLGTNAENVNHELGKACDLAARWNAILLIDEADVFLEKRSLRDIERNAVVSVFLRHIEYHRGILFLTTNRVATFDEAFLSRFHVALHFDTLNFEIKSSIWRSFLRKVGSQLPDTVVAELAEKNLNGRQIKNACQTASSLALSRGEQVQETHLLEALDAMEQLVHELTTTQDVAPAEGSRLVLGRLFYGLFSLLALLIAFWMGWRWGSLASTSR